MKKHTIEEVKNIVYDIAGYIVVDDVYIDNKTKITAVDECGYKYYFALSNLKFAGAARMVSKSNPYSLKNIQLWMDNHDTPYKLLSTEYVGNGTKNREKCLLKLKCCNGHIFYRTWNDIQHGIRCEECSRRFNNHEEFCSYISELYNGEYEIIGTYTDSASKIKVKHVVCGTVFDIRAEHLANGHGCPNTICCKKRGADHYRYDENITDEERLLRRDINPLYSQWRMAVYKKYNYTCDVCGRTGSIAAHHLYAWGSYKDKRFDVSNGVVMCSCCHRDFHNKYGYGKNTPEQYYEYKNNHGNTEVIKQIA